ARPRGAPGVCTSVTFARPEWSIQRRSAGRWEARTLAALRVSKENAPAEAAPAHTSERAIAAAAPRRRPATATAHSERQAAIAATASAPSAVPRRLSSRKTPKRNGESCLLSAAVKPERGTRADSASIEIATSASTSRRGHLRETYRPKAGAASGRSV